MWWFPAGALAGAIDATVSPACPFGGRPLRLVAVTPRASIARFSLSRSAISSASMCSVGISSYGITYTGSHTNMEIRFQIKSSTVEKEELVELRRRIEASSTIGHSFKGRTKATRVYISPSQPRSKFNRSYPKRKRKSDVPKRRPAASYIEIFQSTYDSVNVVLSSRLGQLITTAVLIPLLRQLGKWAKQRFEKTARSQVVTLFGPDGHIIRTIEFKK
jgi:hypothetical protein